MITLREAARATKFSIEALRARCALGKIAGARQDSEGRWLIPQQELDKLGIRLAEPLYSPREAASLLSFTEEHIRRMLRNRKPGDSPQLFSRAVQLWGEWRIPESDLIDLIEQYDDDEDVESLKAEAAAAR